MIISCKTCSNSTETENKRVLRCSGLAAICYGDDVQISESATVRKLRQTYSSVLVKESFYCKLHIERPPHEPTQ